MTPNFDEGTDKTHSIGVPGFVGEPAVRTDEIIERAIEVLTGCGTCDYVGARDYCRACKLEITRLKSLSRSIRGECARELRELPRYDFNHLSSVVDSLDADKLADTWEGK
jgi:hypothetical protein